MIQVAITDDHPLLVEGFKHLINSSGVAETVWTAPTAAECTRMLNNCLPDVLLLDINLPDGSGIDICKNIKSRWPSLPVLALTGFGEYSIVKRMLDNGANGYLLKNSMAEEIIAGIEAVVDGEQFLCHEIDVLVNKRTTQHVTLTQRESEILRLIIDGHTNAEIADKLFLSVETVNSYRKNLLIKLNARNTAVMVRMAIEEKLV
ncbi:MAG: response regulator [Paludibacteraceae bacterium]